MDNIDVLEIYSVAVMIIWTAAFVTTGPFLFKAAQGHQRSTLMTVAILGFLGMIQSIVLWDTMRLTPVGLERSTHFWVSLWVSRTASLLMSITLGVRIWRVMLRSNE